MFREKSWVFFELLLPFLATSAFVFVYRSLQAPSEYVGFVVLGGALTAFWLNVIWMMANQLYWEKSQGNLELYFAAPIDIMAILFGMAARRHGDERHARGRSILVVASWLFGVTFSVDQWFLLVAVFVLTLTALYGLGMMLASLFLVWGREAYQLTAALHRARLLRLRTQLPGRAARDARGAGHRHDPARGRPRRDAPAGLRRVGRRLRHAIARGRGPHPRRDDRGLPVGRALDAPARWSGWRAAKAGLSLRWQ